mmetsp:Transcript_30650/g.101969  ORF Transcript_30650/g.101969 Transcript_30650/m.101969 type:complete len:235 (+) Transcript_30650:69-773(+)
MALGRAPPTTGGARKMPPRNAPTFEGWVGLRYRGRARVSHAGMPAVWLQQTPRSLAEQGGVLSAGRASLTASDCGDEQMPEISAQWVDAQLAQRGAVQSGPQEDRAWIQIQDSVLLIAQAPDRAPYGFVSLTSAALQSTDRSSGFIALSGREPVCLSSAPPDDADALFGDPLSRGSEGDGSCAWIELTLLLHDGRYQVLEAPQLELRAAGAEFDAWASALAVACAERAPVAVHV